jgi:uncharacterized protein (DUF58 family)
VPVPTPRLALLAAAGAVVLLASGAETGVAVLVLDAVLLVVAAVDWAACVPLRAVEVQRASPDVVVLGTEVPLTWRLVNRGRRHVRVAFSDHLVPSLRPARRGGVVHIGPEAAVETDTTLRPSRRGRFDLGTVSVRITGPLGLVSRQDRRRVPASLRVYPAFRSRAEAELRVNRARLVEVGLRSAQGRGGGTEFDQLREYTPDDEFRRVDWAATARLHKPIVRTYRAEQNQTVVCLLDNGRVMAGRVDGVPRVEHAIDAVLCLTTVATRLGDRAGLVAFDRQVRAVVPPGHGRIQLGRVTEAMFDLDPELAESDYQGAFATALARFRRRSLLVVFTDLVDQALRDTLLPAMPLIARNHLVIIAAVQDPDVVRWASMEPADPADVFLTAAAIASLEARAKLVATLRGLGATVVDVPAGRLAGELADTYLRVKATGRL